MEKKCMEDNHPAHKHICLLCTLKVNDVCWQAEWSTDDGLKAPMPDVRSIFGLVLFPHSIIPISLPNVVCKAGLRATVAGCILLPWCSSPAPAAAAAVAERHPPSTGCPFQAGALAISAHSFRWPQNSQAKKRFLTCSPNPTHGSIPERTWMLQFKTFECKANTSLAQGLGALNWVHLLSQWHGDADRHLTMQLMQDNTRRKPWS